MNLKIRLFSIIALLLATASLQAQMPPRPDALPPMPDAGYEAKAVNMATTLSEMYRWDRYPTYDVYLAMMQHFADTYPGLCRIDTIGRTVQNRLILCAVLHHDTADKYEAPQFFYSSTIHGDEVTGYYLMLRLIDTLLSGYGRDAKLTALIQNTEIFINPLANPDGTYIRSNNNVRYAQRYNANYVDLNRNYPDPFGTSPLSDIQVENTAMINYVRQHRFRLSANLHGGAEVMNYPWDSFTSAEREHPNAAWWQQVCKRFIDTCRAVSSSHFSDVTANGYTAGGDWYVISNGRQDYMNQVEGCLELTMEVSTDKTLSSTQLNGYWQMLFHPLVNYIGEIHDLPANATVQHAHNNARIRVYPNPTRGTVTIEEPAGKRTVDLSGKPAGIYFIPSGNGMFKIVKL